ncbi:MAG: hypothetical protein BMS9Abin07_1113 [Acidimicrobiia bacterium]|nr:MAG: hypothetical protein BMS9Abin07_1113 [Acidimicrobiia bacterium]
MSEPTSAIMVIGSNIEKERNIPEAVRLLRRAPGVIVDRVSRIFESPSAGGPPDAPDFFNLAVLVHTDLDIDELRAVAHAVEDELGRVRTADANAPRTADVDVVYFGEMVEEREGKPIPDPDALEAAHVVLPIADAVPDWVHPVDGRTTLEIAEQIDDGGVRPVMAIHLSTPYSPRGPEDFDDVSDVYAPRLEALIRQQLIELGEDPDREGLDRTPLRVAKALDYLTSGYSTSIEEVVNDAIFDAEGAEEMVLVRDIEFYSMCEHHMLPFFGTAAVAYLPKGKIIGLSKIARVLDVFARRLQVQERLTNQVALALEDILDPHGVAVVLEGRHLCMMMRGVQKQESAMITSAMRGTFKDNARTRSEFLDLIS